MAVRAIPQTFEFTCDVCGEKHSQNTVSRPQGWANLTVSRDAYDFQGVAVADASSERLLCSSCIDDLTLLVDKWADKRWRGPFRKGGK